MRIGQLAEQTGFSIDTLRYYEKIGLIPCVARDASGRRDYGPDEVRWLGFLKRLNETGMSIKDRVRFAALRLQGDGSVSERRSMLEEHRELVAQQLADLQETLKILDEKVDVYRQLERKFE